MCRLSSEFSRKASDSLECPFSFRMLNDKTYLIREHDPYGEIPHIYARICSQVDSSGNRQQVIVINDTGVGTSTIRKDAPAGQPGIWDIKSFLRHNLNRDNKMPYLVIVSHCHWDHILGLHSLLEAPTSGNPSDSCDVTIMSSSYEPSFLRPYDKLQEHSLCKANATNTPVYTTALWASDWQHITYRHPSGLDMNLPIITIHTPGHTPDSLTWYDVEMRTLYVGDSLYQQETDDSRYPAWGREDPGPVMFTNEGNLLDWWRSIDKLIKFVRQENQEGKPRVLLSVGHVTASADALACLEGVKTFMARVLREKVPLKPWPDNRGRPMAHWTDDSDRTDGKFSDFSVGAPVFVIEEGRKSIPREEWLSL